MEKRGAVSGILEKLCEWKNVRVQSRDICADHIHMLLESPKMRCVGFMGYLKGKSSLITLRAVWGSKIQIQEQGVLVPEGTMSIRWVEHGEDTGLHKTPT